MEALKFAFETIIVGVLALPWLLILVHLFDPGLLRNEEKGFQISLFPARQSR